MLLISYISDNLPDPLLNTELPETDSSWIKAIVQQAFAKPRHEDRVIKFNSEAEGNYCLKATKC